MKTASAIINLISNDLRIDTTSLSVDDKRSIKQALEDGQALASLGITDKDQEAVEEAHALMHDWPHVALHDPRPEYLRQLIERTGVSQQQAAHRIGISARMMRYYLASDTANRPAPYVVQIAIEALAKNFK